VQEHEDCLIRRDGFRRHLYRSDESDFGRRQLQLRTRHGPADYKGKALQLQFTIEDEGVFTMPWSTITYWRSFEQWPEFVCVENCMQPTSPGKAHPARHPDRIR
jgi:hypothetical protein